MNITAIDREIEHLAKATGSYIDAIIEFGTRRNIHEIEDIVDMLSPIIINKVKNEFIEKNFIPGKKKKTTLDSVFSL